MPRLPVRLKKEEGKELGERGGEKVRNSGGEGVSEILKRESEKKEAVLIDRQWSLLSPLPLSIEFRLKL